MTIQQNRSTKSQAKGSLALSTKKRNVIYISQHDPRNNPQYINSHPGQIVVLDDASFALYLKQQNINTSDNLSAPGSSSGMLLSDDESLTDFPNALNDLAVPGKPVWNPSDITYVSTDTGIFENITITFERSKGDPGDGSYTYHVNYMKSTPPPAGGGSSGGGSTGGTTGGGSSGGSSGGGQGTLNPVGTITTINHTSSFFAIQWKALPNAVHYTVTVKGWDIPGKPFAVDTHSYVVPSAGGSSSNSSYAVGSLNYGLYSFTLTSATGLPFTGTYNISVQVNYANGSSTGVAYNVTI